MIIGTPDVELSIGPSTQTELVLGFRHGDGDVEALATANCGTLELYRHALDYHGEAVLAYWIDEHDVTPPLSGQQSLPGVVA